VRDTPEAISISILLTGQSSPYVDAISGWVIAGSGGLGQHTSDRVTYRNRCGLRSATGHARHTQRPRQHTGLHVPLSSVCG
jgi:hypothetical protein